MKPVSLTAALVMAALAAAASAQSASAEDPSLERVVCKSQKTLGSMMGSTKVCKTRREWNEIRLQQRGQLERMQQRVTPNRN